MSDLKELELEVEVCLKDKVPQEGKRYENNCKTPFGIYKRPCDLPHCSYQNNEYTVTRKLNIANPLIKPSNQQREKENVQHGSEMTLSEMGYDESAPVEWDESINLPIKESLCDLMNDRVHNFVNTDFKVNIGEQTFDCHHLVLACYSPYFNVPNVHEVTLPEDKVSKVAFQIIYEWIIFPEEEMTHVITRKNLLQVFIAAKYLGITDLEEQCWTYIDSEDVFSEGAAFALYREAREHDVFPVAQLMIQRIMKFFLVLVSSQDFLDLKADELCTILRSNYISVNSEIEVFLSAVRWLMHDWDEREQYAVEAMQCVRFGLIIPRTLVEMNINPENPEVLLIMSIPAVNAMREGGLSFSILHYLEKDQSRNWIAELKLQIPEQRNWVQPQMKPRHVTYRDFLEYLDEVRHRGKADSHSYNSQ